MKECDSDFDRLLAVLSLLLALGISPAVVLAVVMAYLWSQCRR